ncbi:transmembrane protein 125 isoform X2 [Carcharodon carcharias]|uniref:transmembrane protein 125 isoform X2 n=1 Tax=Carcharodon carcharias TaxID=13397 RepID=UPI001B7E9B88|nr:transmembrane protein 125 isoform X2 [Carcharodon carcharias]XP_041064549.1 transmembrane protein 125 isoform X2 [Carcharodon carcharias]XP_041064552.1 transmembrane protein 125 isoform X2 [Carcharodon carcharias]XP_041064554.1 transmembrane protein 125 isoform X2 [Carcharodon carcharias]XP_041064555.1 transmembrane protein 125 isoform X2 [Carcharodon carcharias]XP_041064556.1 transmembrane protein 125 isoform X2 [Carcharodon carcharias]XP_041064557.1 transmembrane protein 125 isoform X2 [
MPELSEIMSGRFPANPSRIQHSILEDQVELWWFQDFKRSILCYSVAVILILGTGLGGIVLLSTATGKSSEWRLGVGTVLCLLALAILLKQLLSSAIQDMNCMRNRTQIDKLRSGGLIDYLIILVAGLITLVSGYVLIMLANSDPYPVRSWSDMLIAGVAITLAGSIVLLSFLVYSLTCKFCPLIVASSPNRRVPSVYVISTGNTEARPRELSSSTANLI